MPKEPDAPDSAAPDETASDETASVDDERLVVAVIRTGGVAGIRRRWRVEPPRPETGVWIALIDRCPWDAPPQTEPGADRYVWRIQVRMPQEQRERELADSELQGAWRELVDAVRDGDTPSPEPTPSSKPTPRQDDPASPE